MDVGEFYSYNGKYRGEQNSSANTPADVTLEEENVSQLFFHEHDGELSLVVIHDKPNGDDGNHRFEFTGLPDTGEWAVKDDPTHAPDEYADDGSYAEWAWGNCCSDGGAYRWSAEEDVEFTVEPSDHSYRSNTPFDGIDIWKLRGADGTSKELDPASITVSIGERVPTDGEFGSLVDEKRALIESIRAVADDEPEEIASSEQTDQIPSDGGDTVVGFLSDQASTIDTSAESLVETYDEQVDDVDRETREQYVEGVRRLKHVEKITNTAAIHGIPVSRETGELLVAAIIGAIPFGVGELAAKSSRISTRSQRIIEGLTTGLLNGFVQDAIDAVARTIDRTLALLLGDLSGDPAITSIAENLEEDLVNQFPVDRLEELGMDAFEGLRESATSNGWNLDPNNLVDFDSSDSAGAELTDLGMDALSAEVNAAKESDHDAFYGINDLLDDFADLFGEQFYRGHIFSLDGTLDSMVEEIETRVDDEDLTKIDDEILEEMSDGPRGDIQATSTDTLQLYEMIRFVTDVLTVIELVLLLIAGLLAMGAIETSGTIVGAVLGFIGALGFFLLAEVVGAIFVGLNLLWSGIGIYSLHSMIRIHMEGGNNIVNHGGG